MLQRDVYEGPEDERDFYVYPPRNVEWKGIDWAKCSTKSHDLRELYGCANRLRPSPSLPPSLPRWPAP
jgi:hypothetical protein